ncbi:hypothetical protein CSKR_102801, partial [Clonorchis sinensis]
FFRFRSTTGLSLGIRTLAPDLFKHKDSSRFRCGRLSEVTGGFFGNTVFKSQSLNDLHSFKDVISVTVEAIRRRSAFDASSSSDHGRTRETVLSRDSHCLCDYTKLMRKQAKAGSANGTGMHMGLDSLSFEGDMPENMHYYKLSYFHIFLRFHFKPKTNTGGGSFAILDFFSLAHLASFQGVKQSKRKKRQRQLFTIFARSISKRCLTDSECSTSLFKGVVSSKELDQLRLLKLILGGFWGCQAEYS